MARAMAVSTRFGATDNMTPAMRKMSRGVDRFSANARRGTRRVGQGFQSMRRMAGLAAAAITTGLIGRGIKALVSEASSLETVTTQFETLTGSMENATQLVDDMRRFAATTPLQFETLAEGTQRLMAFGIEQENVLALLRVLGDTALGDAQKLDSLTRAFGKVSARGRASMEEINMVIDAGVPIMDALASQFGVTIEELQKMITAGEVSADVFETAFRSMTSEGGQFFRGMERQSATQAGLWSTLKDNITIVAGSLGSTLLPITKELTGQAIEIAGRINEWVTANKDLIAQRVRDFIQGIVNTGRAFVRLWDSGLIPAALAFLAVIKAGKVAMIAYNAVVAAGGVKALVAAKAQAIWNATMMANPIGLIILAVAALIAIIILVVKNWDWVKEKLIAGAQAVGEFFAGVWEGIKVAFVTAFDFIKAYYATVADVILTVFAGIAKAVLGVAGKVGDALGFDTSGIDNVIGKIEEVQSLVRDASFIGGSNQIGGDDNGDSGDGSASRSFGGPMSPNAGMLESRRYEERRSTVDVNFSNLPRGTAVRQTGEAPDVNTNLGFAGAQ